RHGGSVYMMNSFGASILTTVAPSWASCEAANGATPPTPKLTTRTPVSGSFRLMMPLLLGARPAPRAYARPAAAPRHTNGSPAAGRRSAMAAASALARHRRTRRHRAATADDRAPRPGSGTAPPSRHAGGSTSPPRRG